MSINRERANGMNLHAESDRDSQLRRLAANFGNGNYAEAERIARELSRGNAADDEALRLLAEIVNRQGRLDEAIALMRQLLERDPMNAAYHDDMGAMLASGGRWQEAEEAHRLALVLDPRAVNAQFNLALALFRQRRTLEALQVLDKLEKEKPDFAEQYALRGEILRAENRPDDAVAAFSRAAALGLETSDVLVNLGMALSDAGQTDDAMAVLAKSGKINPEDANANYYLGNLVRDQGDLDGALAYYRKALAQRPDFAEVLNNLGLILQEKGDVRGAEAAFARAMAASPGLGAVHNNMGNCRLKLGQMEAAIACFRKAIDISPESYEVWNNLGETYARLQRLDEAEAAYRRALEIKPGADETELNLGILLLLRGDFENGWKYYEKRWEMPAIKANRPRFQQPEWLGEPLDGKTLLIYVEQGMGDNLQFVRYLKILRDRYPTARIYYWCLRPLFRLFSAYAAECGVELLPEVIPGGVPPIDYHVALLTIPERVGTTLTTIPAEVPYLRAPADLVEKWRERLAGLEGKRVGLVWASGETYLFHMFRTMALSQLKPLLDVPGISWVSLQKGCGKNQIAAEGLSEKILDLMDEAEDFADTAAIIANLDLVISVDTSVPHLAGAMGVPVWLVDRFDTDWRWLLNRSDSPWYPSMRIFRQTAFGDWDSLVPRVAEALYEWVGRVPVLPAKKIETEIKSSPVDKGAVDVLPAKSLKLNLGCGNRKMDGFVNVDFVEACHPDLVVNLEKTPWPWDDHAVDEIKLIHVLEHLGQTTDTFLSIIKEMYRVCRDGAHIEIIVPHPRSDHFLGDPTHVRPVTIAMLNLFDQRLNREWEKMGAANTPLGLILGVDFEVESAVHTLEPDWQQKLTSGQMNESEIAAAVRQFNNVVIQTSIVWRVRKTRS